MVIINREIFPNFVIGDKTPPILQGILNLSPESFYKGSVIQPEIFEGVVDEFLAKNVKILDVGSGSAAARSLCLRLAGDGGRGKSRGGDDKL